jgi:hypothetical protein
MNRAIAFGILIFVSAILVSAQTNEFTYQGKLVASGTAANTPYDFEFRLCVSETDCAAPLETKQRLEVGVSNGVFTVKLDFDAAHFSGPDRWLEILVRPAGSGAFATLSPRQRVTSSPYSIKSLNSTQLGGVDANQYVITTDPRMTDARDPLPNSPNYIRNSVELQNGNFNVSGDGRVGRNLTVDTNTLHVDGTTDRVGIGVPSPGAKLHVAGNVNFVGIRTEQTSNTPNIVGGHTVNTVTAGVVGATIAGGGTIDEFDDAYPNRVTDQFGTVAGGMWNQAGNDSGTIHDAKYATIGGGLGNTAGGELSTIGGGGGNTASVSHSTVTGGSGNSSSGSYSFIGGGRSNSAGNTYAAIAGGWSHTASGPGSFIGSGYNNITNAGAENAAIGGGYINIADGYASAIPGGAENRAEGSYSFAAGRRAKAEHHGSFVWSDQTMTGGDYFTSTGFNQFLINATGGVGIGTNAPQQRLSISHGVNLDQTDGNDGTTTNTLRFGSNSGEAIGSKRTAGANRWGLDFYTGSAHRMTIANNGNVGIGTDTPAYKLDVNGTIRGANVAPSDFRFKQNIRSLVSPLDKLRLLRGVSYNWRADEFPQMNFSAGRSIGFIAQEVERVLPELVSRDEKGFLSLAYSEMLPVVVEAVKEQQKQIEIQNAQIQAQENQIQQQQQRLARQQQQIDQQQGLIDGLRKLVCQTNPEATICREK